MSELGINNPLFRAMARLGDLVVLIVLWLLCCLPVVTAGRPPWCNLAAYAGAAGFAGAECQRQRAVPGAVVRAAAQCGFGRAAGVGGGVQLGGVLLARFTYARGRDALANGLALALRSLPAFRDAEETESLCVNLRDPAGLHVDLWYAVYPDCDIITRAAVLSHYGG